MFVSDVVSLAFHVNEHLGFYFCKWLRMKNRRWIPIKKDNQITSLLIMKMNQGIWKMNILTSTLVIQYRGKSRLYFSTLYVSLPTSPHILHPSGACVHYEFICIYANKHSLKVRETFPSRREGSKWVIMIITHPQVSPSPGICLNKK